MKQKNLLAAVEAFLEAASMKPAAFGRAAMGDPNFVFDLREGRRLWPETEAVVRKFIARRPKQAA